MFFLKENMGPHSSLMMVLPIAKEIELEDAYENMGAQLVKEVATKTNDVVEMVRPQQLFFCTEYY